MKISVSNIGWDKQHDDEMYEYISKSKLNGIEIASICPFELIMTITDFADIPYEQ